MGVHRPRATLGLSEEASGGLKRVSGAGCWGYLSFLIKRKPKERVKVPSWRPGVLEVGMLGLFCDNKNQSPNENRRTCQERQKGPKKGKERGLCCGKRKAQSKKKGTERKDQVRFPPPKSERHPQQRVSTVSRASPRSASSSLALNAEARIDPADGVARCCCPFLFYLFFCEGHPVLFFFGLFVSVCLLYKYI